MKRILIMEVDCVSPHCKRHQQYAGTPSPACPLCRFPYAGDPYCINENGPPCSDMSCHLPKIEGTAKRLLMMEVDPEDRLDPDKRISCPCLQPDCLCAYPVVGFITCSDDNCRLPKINPSDEET
jgi:hypothetical protein